MNFVVIISLALVLNLNACSDNKKTDKQTEQQQVSSKKIHLEQHENQKEQKNYLVKYGFKFPMLSGWNITQEDLKSVNLKGKVKVLETEIVDSDTGIKIVLKYHPGEAGETLFNYYQQQNKQNVNNFTHAGQKAIVLKEVITKDGKGHPISPHNRLKYFVTQPDSRSVLEIVIDYVSTNNKQQEIIEDFINKIQILN